MNSAGAPSSRGEFAAAAAAAAQPVWRWFTTHVRLFSDCVPPCCYCCCCLDDKERRRLRYPAPTSHMTCSDTPGNTSMISLLDPSRLKDQQDCFLDSFIEILIVNFGRCPGKWNHSITKKSRQKLKRNTFRLEPRIETSWLRRWSRMYSTLVSSSVVFLSLILSFVIRHARRGPIVYGIDKFWQLPWRRVSPCGVASFRTDEKLFVAPVGGMRQEGRYFIVRLFL